MRRGVFSTRPRDYYDACILATTQNFSEGVFKDALKATTEHRGTTDQIKDTEKIIGILSESRELSDMWEKYRRQFSYAESIEYSEIIKVIEELLL